jgi:chaperonin GroEL
MSKIINFNEEAKLKLAVGVDVIANSVKSTLGPRGRAVIIGKKFGSPLVTKDGVTVAKEIELQDPVENIGAQLIKEVASKTGDVSGDGTTTATVLAQSIFSRGKKEVDVGSDVIAIKKGLEKSSEAVINYLKQKAVKISSKEDIAAVGCISANNDSEIGELIAEALDKVGKDGIITVEEAKSIETTLDFVEGMQFDRGYISPYFADQSNMEAILDNPYVLVYDKKITAVKDILKLFEDVAKSSRPLLVICEDVDGDALTMMVVNKVRGALLSCAVKAPGFGDRKKEMLKDIAILVGTEVISDETGGKLSTVKIQDLGQCKKAIITKDNTTIIEGIGEKLNVENRVSSIRKQISEATADYDREKLQERLARLTGGVAIIKVGASTEIEMKEKKARVEDAVAATRAALDEGIVPGGGVALFRSRNVVKDLLPDLYEEEKIGANILIEALRKGPVSDLNTNIMKVSVPGTTVKEVKFNEKHQVIGGGYVLKTVKNGEFVKLEE